MPALTEKHLRLLRIVCFALICALLYHALVERKATVRLEATATEPTIFRIYWSADSNGHWSERRAYSLSLSSRPSVHTFKLANLSNIAKLRIDPSEAPGRVTIRSVTITQRGYAPIHLADSESFARIAAGPDIASLRVTARGLEVTADGNDPQLFCHVAELRKKTAFSWCEELLPPFLLALFVCGAGMALDRPGRERTLLIPLALALALVLIASMTAVSRYGVHPDETTHVKAGNYYQQHTFPPPVGAEDIRHTYSVYGVSRLHSGEAAYWFLGKFARLVQDLTIPAHMAQRAFNVTLWALLVFWAFANSDFRLIMLPALLSPQIWYIFSYVNSEAFAFFVMMLAAYQLAAPDSAWNRLLDGRENNATSTVFALFGLGCLLALMLLSKQNFYFFLLFAGLYSLWRVVFGHTRLNRRNTARLCGILLIGLALFGVVRGIDAYVNDFRKGEKLLEARRQFALESWNPDTPLERRHGYLQMRDRGLSLGQVFTQAEWGRKSFRSAFGLYGFMDVKASQHYYRMVQIAGLSLLLAVSFVVCIRGGRAGGALWLVVLTSALGLIGASLHHAWTTDFQPQGRYFLPIVGMLGVFCLQERRYLYRLWTPVLCAGLFLLSLYSFIFVGLAGIPKG